MKKLRRGPALLLAAAVLLAGCGASVRDNAGTEVTRTEETASEASWESIPEEEKAPGDNRKENSETGWNASSEEGESPETGSDVSSEEDESVGTETQQDTKEAEEESADSDLPGGDAAEGHAEQKVIVLDPGHTAKISNETEPLGPGSAQQKAKDAIGTHGTSSGLMEYELTLTVAEQLEEELETRGYTVRMTRTDSDQMLSCRERAEIANEAYADVFLRIHADGSEDSTANGAMTICITPENPYIPEEYEKSRLLSEDVLDAFVSATGCRKRKVWETDSMSGNNWSKVPTTLLEMGFMTNPQEDQLMASADYQQKMVQGMADGIDRYFEDLEQRMETEKT